MRSPRLGSLPGGVALCLGLLLPATLSAVDGRFEIDIDCVAAGCFPGDSGGVGTAAFPVTIANAGSYVLTSNIDAAAMMGNIAISITASNVSLDLNGFFISGVGLMDFGALNITGSTVEVKNGRVIGGAGAGITASGGQIRLVNLRVSSGGGQPGINFGLGMGSDNQVLDTIVTASSFGIAAPGDRSRILGCHVSGGTTDGIRVGSNSIVADNIVTNVTGTGADGIEAGPSSLVSGNVVQGIFGDGIEVGANSLVRGNIVQGNGDIGINLGTDALVIGNTVVGNAAGNVEACMACTLVDNRGAP